MDLKIGKKKKKDIYLSYLISTIPFSSLGEAVSIFCYISRSLLGLLHTHFPLSPSFIKPEFDPFYSTFHLKKHKITLPNNFLFHFFFKLSRLPLLTIALHRSLDIFITSDEAPLKLKASLVFEGIRELSITFFLIGYRQPKSSVVGTASL